jgi:hypothetical protein
MNSVEKAINVLLSLNWDTYGAMCLVSLHKISNYIFKQALTAEREIQLQKALGSFHVPVKALCYETEVEFGDQVNDITVRFFHHLIRYKSYEKAFSLAIDINDPDLFLKLSDRAKLDGDTEIAEEAAKKAEEIQQTYPSDSDTDSHSTCSNTSCSICTDESDEVSDEDERGFEPKNVIQKPAKSISNSSSSSKSHPPLPHSSNMRTSLDEPDDLNYMPPLPYLPRTSSSVAAYKKMTIPKPELKTSLKKIKEKSLSSGNLLDSAEKLIKKPFELMQKPQRSYFNSLSVDHLNYSYLDHFNYNTPTANISKTQKSVVIDVIPKPPEPQRPFAKIPSTIDQSVGIPILYDDMDRPAKKSTWFTAPTTSSNYSSRVIHQYPLISGNIPSKIMPKHPPSLTATVGSSVPKRKEAPSILSNCTNSNNNNSPSSSSTSNAATTSSSIPSTSKRESGEKNKVKFSDTVTVAVVPVSSEKKVVNK